MENQLGTLITFGLIFLMIWFLMVRPQKRARAEHLRLVESIQTGDEVMTNTGIFGTVRSVGDEEVRLEIAPGTEIRLLKRAIHSRVSEDLTEDEEAGQAADRQTENA